VDRATVPDWAALALDAGFHDQSHFNHEFLAFSAFSPREYLAHRALWGHVRFR
jgi:AraC-like DNA-binding protein